MPIHGYPGNIITANPTAPSQTSASGVWTPEDQLQYQTAGNWPPPYYLISRSLRFNTPDSAYLNRTFTTPTAGTKWTYSLWMKKCGIAGTGPANYPYLLCTTGSGAQGFIGFGWTTPDDISFGYSGYARRVTPALFRDYSAWYHLVFSIDTTQAVEADRAKLYVNGVQQTWTTVTSITQNDTTQINQGVAHSIGLQTGQPYDSLNAYLAEIYFIDGQALTPSSFGQTNSQTGVWEPVKYTGTYGTNGFYLNFSDNSGTTSTTLGKDSSGNGNNWTPNNLSVTAGAGNDSLVDTPTSYGTDTGVGGEVRGNYCTMNPLDSKNGTASNGNLLWTATASQSDIRGTFAIPASGKWYMECTVGSNTSASSAVSFGLATSSVALDASNAVAGLYQLYASSSGYLSLNGTNVSSSLGTWTAGDILQIAVDADNTKMWLGKNNTWYDSSGGTTGNPSTGANATSTTSMVGLFPFSNCYQNNATWNAGQRAFAYTAPSGYKALCTQNLPTPTIGATSTTQAGKYMNVALYTGTGSSLSVTGVGFQPDLVWIKSRSNAQDHKLTDAVRGTTKAISSNTTAVEVTDTNGLTTFGSDGFTVGTDATYNTNTYTYVGWNWKANGAGSSNTAGSITSTVSANTTSGCSIVKYTGTAANATVGHGLGVAPSMIIIHALSGSIRVWPVYHISKGPGGYGYLNQTNAWNTDTTGFNNTSPTSTVFSLGNNTDTNTTDSFIAYCFAAVAGYSAFGSYTGNGSSDGPFVFCGFRPRYIMIKSSSNGLSNWMVMDSSRSPYNVADIGLEPNSSTNESGAGGSNLYVDFVSNGFKIRGNRGDINNNSDTYIYAAFAESPFKYALAR